MYTQSRPYCIHHAKREYNYGVPPHVRLCTLLFCFHWTAQLTYKKNLHVSNLVENYLFLVFSLFSVY